MPGAADAFGNAVSLCGDACGRMERWRGRVAAVTGASAGIGAAVCFMLQDAGLTVVGLARRVDKIAAAVEKAREDAESRGRVPPADPVRGELHVRAVDLANEEEIVDAFKWIKDTFGRIDILVNNAGTCGHTMLTDESTTWRQILNVNVLGLSICSREAVKLMREREDDEGYIINVGSIAGYVNWVGNGFAMYVASKNCVRVLTEGLRRELIELKSAIKITCVCPGLVKTEFFDGYESIDPNEWFAMPHMFPEDIADAIIYAISAPHRVQIHDMIIKPHGETL